MSSNLNSQLTSVIQSFVAELSALVRTAALESVKSALSGSAGAGGGRSGGAGTGSTGARRGPGRPKGSGVRRGPGRPKGSGKSTGDAGAVTAKLLNFVTMHDGKRLEEISRALNIPTADLKRPAQTLLAAKAVKTTGAKRGTKYHVAEKSAPSKKPAKKA